MTWSKAAMCLVWTPILFSALVYAEDQNSRGVIAGIVVNEAGSPVAGAHVMSRDLDPNTVEVFAGVVRSFATDRQGKFLISGLTTGHDFKVYAEKEEDGYPNTMLRMYNPKDEAPVAVATLTAREQMVTLHIGPRAGRLKWNVTDAVTGYYIDKPIIRLQRSDNDTSMFGTPIASDGLLVPANTAVIVSVSAHGYREWYYPGTLYKSTAAPLWLIPGEERTLQVQLQPLAK
jgi:hypothetical protein